MVQYFPISGGHSDLVQILPLTVYQSHIQRKSAQQRRYAATGSAAAVIGRPTTM